MFSRVHASRVSSGYSGFLPQSKDICCRVIGIPKLSVECVCVICALRRLGTRSRASPAPCPKSPGIGTRPPATPCSKSGTDNV